MSARFLLLFVLLLTSISCEEPASDPVVASREIEGLVQNVEIEDGQVVGFTLESEGNESSEIAIDPEVDYGFDLHHLEEHQRLDQPVRVTIEERDGTLFAQAILDA